MMGSTRPQQPQQRHPIPRYRSHRRPTRHRRTRRSRHRHRRSRLFPLAAAIEAIASVHAASDKASGNLASDAIRDLKPTDLDEVRAACREARVRHHRANRFAAAARFSSSPTSRREYQVLLHHTARPLPPLSPAAVHQRLHVAAQPRAAPPPHPSCRGTKRCAASATRTLNRLFSFDARRLLAEDATEVLAAVKQRIALDVEEIENAPYPVSEEG